MDTLSLREIALGVIGWRRARQMEANVYGVAFFGAAEEEEASETPEEMGGRLREKALAHRALRQEVGVA